MAGASACADGCGLATPPSAASGAAATATARARLPAVRFSQRPWGRSSRWRDCRHRRDARCSPGEAGRVERERRSVSEVLTQVTSRGGSFHIARAKCLNRASSSESPRRFSHRLRGAFTQGAIDRGRNQSRAQSIEGAVRSSARCRYCRSSSHRRTARVSLRRCAARVQSARHVFRYPLLSL